MQQRIRNRLTLREQIEDKKKIMILPGIYDALSARIAEQIGFNAIFQTGYGSSAALLGMPDYGFLNAGETLDNAHRIIRAINIPMIVDADTGYGNPLTVWRLVRDLEHLGAQEFFLKTKYGQKDAVIWKGKM